MALDPYSKRIVDKLVSAKDEWALCVLYEDMGACVELVEYCKTKEINIEEMYRKNVNYDDDEDEDEEAEFNNFDIANKINELFQQKKVYKERKELDINVPSWYTIGEDGEMMDENDLPDMSMYFIESYFEDEEKAENNEDMDTFEAGEYLLKNVASDFDMIVDNDEEISDFEVTFPRKCSKRVAPSESSLELFRENFIPLKIKVADMQSRSKLKIKTKHKSTIEKAGPSGDIEGDNNNSLPGPSKFQALRHIFVVKDYKLQDTMAMLKKFGVKDYDIKTERLSL